MKKGRRKSRQRDAIYEMIKGSSEHPTAQQIYDSLRNRVSTLSIGNVYRNLNILIEEGLITAREFGDGIVHYDAITHNHYHFICTYCGSIIDFPMPVEISIIEAAQGKTGHTITGHTVQFYGICESCQKRMKKEISLSQEF